MFLTLYSLYPGQTLIPTRAIDLIWHQHILDTQSYSTDCQHLFGKIIHHLPEKEGRTWTNRSARLQGIRLTQALFQEHFGIKNFDPKMVILAATVYPS
jgi:hypothetical protein